MQLKNSYYYFISAIPPETCKRIIELGTEKIAAEKAAGHSVEAYTYGEMQKGARGDDAAPQGDQSRQTMIKEQGSEKQFYVRDSEVTWLNDQWIYDLLHPYIREANAQAGWNWDWDYSESFQFTVYNPGGFYSWHKDGASDHIGAYKRYIHGVTPVPLKPDGKLPEGYVTDPAMVGKIRKISLTLNLNEPGAYEGGNLKFDFGFHTDGEQFHECEEIRPQGSVIIFPSFVDHNVTPITKGTRYSLVLWTLGKPFR
jgi:PKHD-type hydroxylase